MSNRNEFYDLSDSPIVINDTNVKKPKNSGGGVNVNFKSFFKIIILVAIIAVVYHFGKAWIDEYKRPVVDVVDGNKQIVIGKILPMCIAFDHRALDMGDVIPFIKKLDEIFENPEIIDNWI